MADSQLSFPSTVLVSDSSPGEWPGCGRARSPEETLRDWPPLSQKAPGRWLGHGHIHKNAAPRRPLELEITAADRRWGSVYSLGEGADGNEEWWWQRVGMLSSHWCRETGCRHCTRSKVHTREGWTDSNKLKTFSVFTQNSSHGIVEKPLAQHSALTFNSRMKVIQSG